MLQITEVVTASAGRERERERERSVSVFAVSYFKKVNFMLSVDNLLQYPLKKSQDEMAFL